MCMAGPKLIIYKRGQVSKGALSKLEPSNKSRLQHLEDTIRSRRMVRSFTKEPVEREIILGLLDLARQAPSAGNSQGSAFLVLDDFEARTSFWDISLPGRQRRNFQWPKLLDAPVLILPIAEPNRYIQRYSEKDKAASHIEGRDPSKWEIPYWIIDTSFAVQNLLLAASAQNLGVLFFGIFSGMAEIKSCFKIPESAQVLGALALGWPHKDDRPSSSAKRLKRELDDLVRFNSWEQF